MFRTTAGAALIALSLLALGCKVGPTITKYEQLEEVGGAQVYAIQPAGAGESSIEVAFENTTDGAVRVSDMEWTILDGEGFAQATVESENDVEIPPRAKEKLTFTVATDVDDIQTVRLWGDDLDERPGARPGDARATR